MSRIDGVLVHGSPGGFGMGHAPIPRELADGLNSAWRRLHSTPRAEDDQYGSLPLATLRAMEAEWRGRPGAADAHAADGDDVGPAPGCGGTQPARGSDDDSDGPDETVRRNGRDEDGARGGQARHEAGYADTYDGTVGDEPPAATPPRPDGLRSPCQACREEEAGDGLAIAEGAGMLRVCTACFFDHFAFYEEK